MSQSDTEVQMQMMFMHRVLRALVQNRPSRHSSAEA